MQKVLYYSVTWPFILIGSVANFLVWEIFSNGRWKERRKQHNPAIPWQNRAIEARRRFRDLEYESRRQIEELEEALRKEQKSKKR
jgi:hypothetical protein